MTPEQAKELAAKIEQVMESDAKRTQGVWKNGSWKDNVFAVTATDTHPYEKWFPICRVKRDNENIYNSPDMHDAAFIANSSTHADIIRQMQEVMRELVGACSASHKLIKDGYGVEDENGWSVGYEANDAWGKLCRALALAAPLVKKEGE